MRKGRFQNWESPRSTHDPVTMSGFWSAFGSKSTFFTDYQEESEEMFSWYKFSANSQVEFDIIRFNNELKVYFLTPTVFRLYPAVFLWVFFQLLNTLCNEKFLCQMALNLFC